MNLTDINNINNHIDFETIIQKLNEFWRYKQCILLSNREQYVGAATYHPNLLTIFNNKSPSFAFVQPCVRPYDHKDINKNNLCRLGRFHQYEVILKNYNNNTLTIFLQSLNFLGLCTIKNDIRFVENNWESTLMGAYGIGYEVLCNGEEIAQITYINKCYFSSVEIPTVEFSYGLERVLCGINGNMPIYECLWNQQKTYGEIYENFLYMNNNIINYSIQDLTKNLNECNELLNNNLYLQAYTKIIDGCNIFNLLDAKNIFSYNDRKCQENIIQKIYKNIVIQYKKTLLIG